MCDQLIQGKGGGKPAVRDAVRVKKRQKPTGQLTEESKEVGEKRKKRKKKEISTDKGNPTLMKTLLDSEGKGKGKTKAPVSYIMTNKREGGWPTAPKIQK